MSTTKDQVEKFWDEASCGEKLFMKGSNKKKQFENQMEKRYSLKPYILPFAEFSKWKHKKVLEIGVGLGADHQMFAQAGAKLTGVDLTERAITYTKERFELFNLKSNLYTGDAEALPFESDYFDLVYSWGVIHHSPDTAKAVKEISRVLKDDGEARIMIYHKYSLVGFMLWFRYAFLKGHFSKSIDDIYEEYLESPGTKAYSLADAKKMLSPYFEIKSITLELSQGDLLADHTGQRHAGKLLKLAKILYPRFLVEKIFKKNGLFMLIKVKKSSSQK